MRTDVAAGATYLRRVGTLSGLRPLTSWDPARRVSVEVCLAATEVDDLLIVLDDASRPMHAIPRLCVHRQCDIAAHVHPGICTGTFKCKHSAYQWDARSGEFVGSARDGCPVPIIPTLTLGDVIYVSREDQS